MTTETPLSSASPAAVEDLFNRDPLSLSDQDIDALIKLYREQRAAWLVEAASAKRPKSATKARAEAVGVATGGKISLADIGL